MTEEDDNKRKAFMKNNGKKGWFQKYGLYLVLVIILLGVFGALSGDKNDIRNDTNTNYTPPLNQTTTTEQTKTLIPKIGEAASDGKFEFNVKSIKCGVTDVSMDSVNSKHAQGQFCILSLTVKNIGTTQETFSYDDQNLLDAQSFQYSYDGVATIFNGGSSFSEQINPGNSFETAIVFDLPKDKMPTKAELHDSAFSSGVKISLE